MIAAEEFYPQFCDQVQAIIASNAPQDSPADVGRRVPGRPVREPQGANVDGQARPVRLLPLIAGSSDTAAEDLALD